MKLYFVGNGIIAELKVNVPANFKAIDEIMAKDGLKRCTRVEYLRAKSAIDKKLPEGERG